MHSVSKKQVGINLGEADQVHECEWTRRKILKVISAAGVGSAVFGRALLAQVVERGTVTEEMIRQAEWITGMEFSDQERELMRRRVSGNLGRYAQLREVPLDPEVRPALAFNPAPWAPNAARGPRGAVEMTESAAGRRPDSSEDLAFATVTELAALVRTRQVSSVELTRLYLDRLRRYDPVLHCVITYTDELALNQAEKADREIAAGRYRGPLHGIPWGAKDNLAVPGYRTTWGAMPYRDQVLSQKATVAARLEEAGAVLVAKLAKGAFGGDVWFGGQTRNPWNPERGTGGSSAGSAAATAAGLVGFSIGTEGRGSIVWPSRNCGVTGLRPTFGRVSLYGTAPGGWSTRKVGPIARSVEDCALVLHAIHGADGLDPSAVDRPFHWPLRRDVRSLRVGYVESLFESDRTESSDPEEVKAAQREWQQLNWRTLEVLRELGIELIPISLPNRYPVGPALGLILNAETATGFDELTRSGRDDLLVRPNAGLLGDQLIPAVEYIRANRIRTLVMEEMERLMSDVDVYVSPSGTSDSDINHTNLAGYPAVVLPNGYGFRSLPQSSGVNGIMFTGKLYGETELLALAHAYQQATDFHLQRPPLQNP